MAGQIIGKGPGKWLLRVFTGRDGAGRRHYHSETVHGGKKLAEQRLAKLLSERTEGTLVVAPRGSLGEYLDTWLQTTAAPSVRARTLDLYTQILARYVRPHLGQARLARLSPVEVRGMLVKLSAAGLSPRIVRMAHEVLRNALEQAVSDRLIVNNPARARLVRKALPPKPRRQPATVKADQVAIFLDVARADRLGPYFTLLLFSGLRPEEALALRWADLNGNVVSVHRVLVDASGMPLHFEEPKSATSRRAVALPDIAVQALQEHRRAQAADRLAAGADWRDNDLIFCGRDGEPVRQYTTRETFKKILAAAELPAMRVYDLRHSCASLLLEAGVGLKVVSERLGHSSVALTGDTYAHVAPGLQQQAADALGRLATT